MAAVAIAPLLPPLLLLFSVALIVRRLIDRRAYPLAFIPLIGIGFAISSLNTYANAFVYTRDHWNPARAHLYFGAALALCSLLLHGLVATGLVLGSLF